MNPTITGVKVTVVAVLTAVLLCVGGVGGVGQIAGASGGDRAAAGDAALGSGHHSTPARPSYVALGESFSAQSGSPLYNREPCERAPGTYPALVARELDLVVANVACSGASSADLLTRQPGAAGPQVAEVAPHAGVVTILIGLDDLGAAPFRFIGELSGCQAGNATADRFRTCQTLPGMTGSALGQAIDGAGQNLAASLRWLRLHRRATRVLVLDYPAVIGAVTCPADVGLIDPDAVLYRSVLDRLDAVLRSDAEKADDRFVDLYTPSIGPRGCPDWLTPPTATSVFPSHPSVRGEAAMARVVATAVARALHRSLHRPRSASLPSSAAGSPGHSSLLSEPTRWP